MTSNANAMVEIANDANCKKVFRRNGSCAKELRVEDQASVQVCMCACVCLSAIRRAVRQSWTRRCGFDCGCDATAPGG